MVRLDMHVHTEYSADSGLRLSCIARFLSRNPEFALCVTDHNEIEGALKLKKLFPERIIVGEEIRTAEGEITGLFLTEKISRGMSVKDTCDAIAAQGGLIYIPHPADRLRTSKLTPKGLEQALERCDILEVYNSRNVFKADDDAALALAKRLGKAAGCGSDAHTRMELGRSYAQLNRLGLTPGDFLSELENGCMVTRRSFLGVHFLTKCRKFIAGI